MNQHHESPCFNLQENVYKITMIFVMIWMYFSIACNKIVQI